MNDISQDQNRNQANGQNGAAQPDDESQGHWKRRRGIRGARTETSWIAGVVLIVMGVIFMAQTMGGFYLNNWWALFILLPAIGSFGAAWKAYQDAGGQLNSAARGSLLGGFVLVCIACVFLLNLNWAIIGPVLLILAGVGMLVNYALPK